MAIHNPRGREIPHYHRCCVCGVPIGCSDDNCHLPDWVNSCSDPECEVRAENAIVHLQPGMGLDKLRCCGLHPGETSRGDRMTYKESEVTCPAFTEQKGTNPSAKKSQAAKAQQPSA